MLLINATKAHAVTTMPSLSTGHLFRIRAVADAYLPLRQNPSSTTPPTLGNTPPLRRRTRRPKEFERGVAGKNYTKVHVMHPVSTAVRLLRAATRT